MSQLKIEFRKLKRTDRKLLLAFAEKLTSETKMRWGLLEEPEEIVNFLMEERHRNGCKMHIQIVGIQNKAIICYGKLSVFESGTGYLEGIIVRSDMQGKGVGKQLMLYLEGIATRKKCPYVKLEVFKENTKAIGFYEHIGYKKRGQSFDSWFMRKYLNPTIPKKENFLRKILRRSDERRTTI
jgi:ribosomal protein S18 acetylase RimI-like enzyme